MKTCFLDFETSIPKGSDISKQGTHRFLEDAEPYLLAFAIGDEPVRVVTLENGLPDEVLYADLFVAHNAGFDRKCSMRLKEYRPAAPWDKWYLHCGNRQKQWLPWGIGQAGPTAFRRREGQGRRQGNEGLGPEVLGARVRWNRESGNRGSKGLRG